MSANLYADDFQQKIYFNLEDRIFVSARWNTKYLRLWYKILIFSALEYRVLAETI
jgi:hypothetical protein